MMDIYISIMQLTPLRRELGWGGVGATPAAWDGLTSPDRESRQWRDRLAKYFPTISWERFCEVIRSRRIKRAIKA